MAFADDRARAKKVIIFWFLTGACIQAKHQSILPDQNS